MEEEEVIVSIRVPKKLRQQFQVAMKEADTNASVYLRAAMEKRVAGTMPAPLQFDPIDLARQILDGQRFWTNINPLNAGSDPKDLKDLVRLFNILAYTVIEQNRLLEQVVRFGGTIASEREKISQECYTAEIVEKNVESYVTPLAQPNPGPLYE